MIRIGIIGSNYGRTVLLPAFRADPRCEVIALGGSNAARTADLAREAGIPKAYGDWRALVDDKDVQAVVIATLPSLQPDIAIAALQAGKPVFAEKPLAGDLAAARAMLTAAEQSGLPTGIDFNFTRIMAWLRAKEMLDQGCVGPLRHVTVHWHVESRAIQMRMRNWKTAGGNDGGGVLGNFISHCFHYLEWFAGPIGGLQARVSGLPDDAELQTTVAMAMQYKSGPQISLSMSCASYAGMGHHIEFFGEDGTLVLHNPTADYMRGFDLTYAKRPDAAVRIAVDDPLDAQYPDGRIAPVSRLVNKFFDAIETGKQTAPDFADGYRAQALIDAAQRSHRQGQWIDVAAVNGRQGK
ncbi:MAG: Gfo/Idh/MocA family oxidoreductase [Pseudolabrys sp.]|nr:Gfo/Idh/MocA family oxidoreductase [Pseudolabrys sp.]MDP2296881.1 Gfo/Idh/MocA family oxidoreductase [Pseudolabrys sp.]